MNVSPSLSTTAGMLFPPFVLNVSVYFTSDSGGFSSCFFALTFTVHVSEMLPSSVAIVRTVVPAFPPKTNVYLPAASFVGFKISLSDDVMTNFALSASLGPHFQPILRLSPITPSYVLLLNFSVPTLIGSLISVTFTEAEAVSSSVCTDRYVVPGLLKMSVSLPETCITFRSDDAT